MRWRQVRWLLPQGTYNALRNLHDQFTDQMPSEEDFAMLVLTAGIEAMRNELQKEKEKAMPKPVVPTSEQMVRML